MHRNSKVLKNATDGMINKWKNLAQAGNGARATWEPYAKASDFAAGRQQMNHILGKFGIDRWTCVKKVQL